MMKCGQRSLQGWLLSQALGGRPGSERRPKSMRANVA